MLEQTLWTSFLPLLPFLSTLSVLAICLFHYSLFTVELTLFVPDASAGFSLCACCILLHCMTVVIMSWRKHLNIYFLPSYKKRGMSFCAINKGNAQVISFHLKWLIALRINLSTYTTWVATAETKILVAAPVFSFVINLHLHCMWCVLCSKKFLNKVLLPPLHWSVDLQEQFRSELNDLPVPCSLLIMQTTNWESWFRCLLRPTLTNPWPVTLSLILHPPICLRLAVFPMVSTELRTTCRADRPVKEMGHGGGRGGQTGSRRQTSETSNVEYIFKQLQRTTISFSGDALPFQEILNLSCTRHATLLSHVVWCDFGKLHSVLMLNYSDQTVIT